MKIKLFAGLLAALFTTASFAQPYSIFSPGPSGPVKSNGTYALQQEFSSDIIGLWTGSCSLSTFLRGDGACAAVGTVTSISQGTGITATPNPITGTGSIAINQAFSPTWTGNHIFSPASGVPVIVNGVAGQLSVSIIGSATSGQSQGERISAGTTSADFALLLRNQAGTQNFLQTFGDGGTVLGSATGGDKGLGSLNASSLFVNNVAVNTSNATVSSVGLTLPACFSVTGSPVTGAGTLAATMTGGTTTFLRGDGTCVSVSTSPGGSNTQVQYNNAGAFGGSSGFTWDNTNLLATVTTGTGLTAFKGVNDGVHDIEFLASSATAGDAYYRAVTLGGTNWSWGTQRSTNNWVLANGVGLGSSAKLTISTNGNSTIPAPSSGSALTVTGVATGASPAIFLGGAAGAAGLEINSGMSLAINSAGTDFGFVQNDSSNKWSLAHGTSIAALGTDVLSWNTNGNVTIPSPTGTGVALTLNTTSANSSGTLVFNNSTTGLVGGYIGNGAVCTGQNAMDLCIAPASAQKIIIGTPAGAGVVGPLDLTGSYTATATGCTTSPTITVNYQVNGRQVHLWGGTITCTSNTGAFALTGAPAIITPGTSSDAPAITDLEDNSLTGLLGAVVMNTSGSLIFSKLNIASGQFSAAGFTASGTKGLLASSSNWNIIYATP